MKIDIVRYKMLNKGYALALAKIRVPDWGNLLIDGVTLFFKPPNKWIGFPSRKDNEGKYWPYIKFEADQDKKDFEKEVFKAFEAKVAEDNVAMPEPEFAPDGRNYYD